MKGPNPALLIMCKWPKAGAVKTRLSPFLAPEEAALLYRAMLLDVFAASLQERLPVLVAFTPEERARDFEKLLGGGAAFFPQRGDHLAARMGHAFQDAFARGFHPVILRNSDGPTLPPQILRAARVALRAGADASFSPDTSRGFGVMGLQAPAPEPFLEPLGEDSYEDMLRRCADAGLSTMEVGSWYDVDTPADLKKLLQEWREGKASLQVSRFLTEQERGSIWLRKLG